MKSELPSHLNLKILSPFKVLVERKVEDVTLPSLEGYLGIFPGHRPLMILLGSGRITYRAGGREYHIPAGGGTAEVLPESVTVFVTAPGPDDAGADEA